MTSARLGACARLLACAALTFPAALVAQQEGEMSPEQAAMMQKWTEYATPSAAHEQLAQGAGEWEWTSTWWMEPGAPPQTSSGTASAEMTLGGRYLVENFQGSMWGQPFEGRSTTGYDNHTQEYFSTWIDNMGTGILVQRGKADPESNTLTMTGTFEDFMDGETKTVRSVMTHVDPHTMRMEMYMPGPDGKEFKTMELVSKRKGS